MKKINQFIIERLKLSKNDKIQKRNLSYINDRTLLHIDIVRRDGSKIPPISTYEAHAKNTDPKRHVNHIKNISSLIYRWWICIVEGWEEYYEEFKEAIIKKSNFTADELDAFILDKYIGNQLHKSYNEKLEEYLDNYNVEYDKK